ncbi:DUF1236 domain-containing protein [Aminobacter sp. MET-1]|uniref:DUF1236 domain-containing protein n=1 Tax=Aminobacter sp. MET-1 TaxID=2951085 RepID=UPI00226A6819|nr:DUF1236 domain-containing protein [Aminobacter sp. MET-1]MCX8570780.1 DUF1236 domain-containing protein [Aminobacter sp. MET-1]
MRSILISSAIALSLSLAGSNAFAQTQQPMEGGAPATKCAPGSKDKGCVTPEGKSEQGAPAKPQKPASGQSGEAAKPTPDQMQQGTAGQSAQGKSDRTKKTEPAQGEAATPTKPESSSSGQAAQPTPSQGAQTKPAQTNGSGSGTSTSTTTNVTNTNVTVEQKTEITKVIKEERSKPVRVTFDVNVGVALPQKVKVSLRPLPARIIKIVPAYRHYLYFVLDDGRIVIVEPSTLKIVLILV